MKIAIIGTGGVGGYFGAKLAQQKNEVIFLARGAHLEAIRKNGLEVKSILGDFRINPAKVTDDINQIGIVDLVILGVKAWQVNNIAKELNPLIDQNTVVLPLQNGILASEELATEINPQNIIGGLCKIISEIESPGVINHFGIEPNIVIGEINGIKCKNLELINKTFTDAGINCRISNDFPADLWKKFIAICVSGLLAVTCSNYGEVRSLKETRELMRAVLTEIYLISQKEGINLKPDIVEKTMEFIDTYPYNSTSSLTRDVWEGKPSEIDYQNGTVVKLGRKYEIPTPINEFIYSCILPMELRARK